MNGWLFAVALLVAILGFELAVFRYFSDASLASALDSDSGSDADATRVADGGVAVDEAEGRTHECHDCGAVNGDVGTFHYCHNCLSRIR
jgi:hypothetical protein